MTGHTACIVNAAWSRDRQSGLFGDSSGELRRAEIP